MRASALDGHCCAMIKCQRAFAGKQKMLILPRFFNVFHYTMPFPNVTFREGLAARGFRRCPWQKHHVFQWFSQTPLADPHCRQGTQHSAAIWWKAGNVDFTKVFNGFHYTMPCLRGALPGQTVKSSRFPMVFDRFRPGTLGHVNLVEMYLLT